MSEEKRLKRLGMLHLIDKPVELEAETRRQIEALDAKAAVLRKARLAKGVQPRRTPRPA